MATFTAGQILTAAQVQTISDNADYVNGNTTSTGKRKPLFLGRQTIAQSIPNAVVTSVTLDAEDVDYDNGHSLVTSTDRYVCGTAGWYMVTATGGFVSNATGERYVAIGYNGNSRTAWRGNAATTGNPTIAVVSTLVNMSVSDWVSILLLQSSGVALNTSSAFNFEAQCRLSVHWVSA